jgi:putative NIF3 family GTP cyclohydrolase 1 type 2
MTTLRRAATLTLLWAAPEPAERVAAVAREERIHFIAAGHHATETLGVRRLGELIAQEHAIVHNFIDIPNPI